MTTENGPSHHSSNASGLQGLHEDNTRDVLSLSTRFPAAEQGFQNELWNALTVDRERWWPGMAFEPTPGATVHEVWEEGGARFTASGEVTSVDAGAVLSFVWKDDQAVGAAPLLEVTFKILTTNNEVVLELTESGFSKYPNGDALFAEHLEGWAYHLGNLRAFISPQAPALPDLDGGEQITLGEAEVVGFLTQRILNTLEQDREPQVLDFASIVSGLQHADSRNPSPNHEAADVLHESARAVQRKIFAVVGKPGAGKSTLVSELVTELERANVTVAVLPMDGFHLSNAQLERIGLADMKGSPATFDADGYVAALERIVRADHDVYVPVFHREIEESYAADGFIPRDAQVVLTEGNYLALPTEPWKNIRPLVSQVWYLNLDDQTRVDRLVQRHVEHGKTAQEAISWTLGSDEANARLIESSATRADLVVNLEQ